MTKPCSDPNPPRGTLTLDFSRSPPLPLTSTSSAMESNKDEAVRCLAIAQKHRDAGNYTSARKFVQKSMALFETAEATKLLASINAAENQAGSSSSANGSSSSAEARPSDSKANHRTASSSSSGTAGGMGGEKREYTTEQVTVVKRVRTCKVTDYYEILAVSKSCSEADVRKAYRKVCPFTTACA